MKNQNNFIEAELILRLTKGDMKAFDEIYWKFQKAVMLNALKLTRDISAAEDIVQEVFISLWEKRQTIDINLSLTGWLFVSSYNRSVNVLKKKLRESLAADKFKIDDSITEPFSEINDSQMLLLNEAVYKLSPQKRKVFEICKLQGKSYEEAAAEMNISKHTVKEYLSEAVFFVKNYIKDHPILLLAIFPSW